MVGSVAMFPVFEAILGERVIDISDGRFASAGIDLLQGQGVESEGVN